MRKGKKQVTDVRLPETDSDGEKLADPEYIYIYVFLTEGRKNKGSSCAGQNVERRVKISEIRQYC